MSLYTQTIAAIALGGTALTLYSIYKFIIGPMLSPISKLPGAPNESFLFGHTYEVHIGNPLPTWQRWADMYGSVCLAMGPLHTRYAVVSDVRAVKELITHVSDFVKPYQARTTLSLIIGAGLVTTEGEAHKRQRKLLNICFYPAAIKRITPIFYEQANDLRDVLFKAMDKSEGDAPVLDMYHYFLSTVLNMIGLAGFNYQFNALHIDEKPNELYNALMNIYLFDPKNVKMSLLRLAIPDLHRLPTARKARYQEGLRTFKRVTSVMLQDRKNAMFKALGKQDTEKQDEECLSPTEHNYMKGRDLLSALVKANADPAIPNDQRLSDEEVLSQIKTFLVAGHETTATALAWCIYELACNPSVQSKLRDELRTTAAETEQPSIDILNALPYLDGVLRESMRLRPAIPYTMRVATKDNAIPLSKAYTDRDGKVCNELHVKKGDKFVIPIEAMNRYTDIWGPDANEFKPERWADGLDTGIPGVWSSMLTFLGGPRSCIGYRFAIYEMKVILYTLLPVLEFTLDGPADDIAGMTCISKRPYAKSQADKGFQMPVRVKRHVPIDD